MRNGVPTAHPGKPGAAESTRPTWYTMVVYPEFFCPVQLAAGRTFNVSRPGRCSARSWIRRVSSVVEVVGESVRGTHTPCVGDQFPEAVDVHLCQSQHDQGKAVIGGRGEERGGVPGAERPLFRLLAGVQHPEVGPGGGG